MLFKKSEHMITQVVALSSPVSAVYAGNAWRPRTACTLRLGLSYGSPSNKSCGVDKKPASSLRETANASAAPLSMFFNLSVKKRRLPKLWKSADITPIHKDGEREPVENYRRERS